MGQYIRHAVAPLENIFDAIREGWSLDKPRHSYDIHTFNVSSLRLRTFCRDAGNEKLHCANCGLKASFFAVEAFARNTDNKSVHVNLYGVKEDGEEVLFTHDHIVARGLGGPDTLNNSQTMCGPCNWAKGTAEGHIINRNRFLTTLGPKAKDKMIKLLLKQENPTLSSDLELQLGFWAANKDLDSFTRKLDDWLYKHGWKRRKLKQEIVAGNIKFDRFPVSD
jgi:hypothetical protein